MKLEFCAVMRSGEAPEGPGWAVVRAGALAAIFAETAGGAALPAPLRRGGGAARGAALAARQRLLERLQEGGDVLPAAPGARLAPDAARSLLAGEVALLGQGLGLVADRAQWQITVHWDAAAAATHFAEALVGRGLAAFGAGLAEEFAAKLAAASVDVIRLPIDGPGMLVNLVCLVSRDVQAALEAAVREIDATWTEGLHIRVVGPSPAIAFAAVAATRPGAREVAAALVALGFARVGAAPTPSAPEVEKAFRTAARHRHLDAGGAGGLDALHAARRLLLRLGRARAALRAAARPDDPRPPLAVLLRDGAPSIDVAFPKEAAA